MFLALRINICTSLDKRINGSQILCTPAASVAKSFVATYIPGRDVCASLDQHFHCG